MASAPIAPPQTVIGDVFGVERVALELKNPRFYHLDTALCCLPRGEIMFVPDAFTPPALAVLNERVDPGAQIEVDPADARRLAANAVCVGDTIVMSGCGERLKGRLAERGYRVIETALPSFLRSGGAAFCLTLRLDRRSSAGQERTVTAAPDFTSACA